jgi:hypothetical protein
MTDSNVLDHVFGKPAVEHSPAVSAEPSDDSEPVAKEFDELTQMRKLARVLDDVPVDVLPRVMAWALDRCGFDIPIIRHDSSAEDTE